MKQSECQRARESVSRREECFNSEMDWCLQAATYPNSEHDTGFTLPPTPKQFKPCSRWMTSPFVYEVSPLFLVPATQNQLMPMSELHLNPSSLNPCSYDLRRFCSKSEVGP